MSLANVNTLAAIIRDVDGNHSLGAAQLAEAILGHPLAKELVSDPKIADPAILDSGQKVKQLVEDAKELGEEWLRVTWAFDDEERKERARKNAAKCQAIADALESLATESSSLKARLEESEERVRELEEDKYHLRMANEAYQARLDAIKGGTDES